MFSSQLPQGDRATVGQVKLVTTSPLLHFICCEVSFLVRNEHGGEKGNKSMDGSFTRNNVSKEGKSISRENVHYTKNKALPFP